jgi:hypothetical protein
MTRNRHIAVLVGALAVAAVGLVVAGGGSSERSRSASRRPIGVVT